MTVRAFAESRGITPTTMCWWRSRPGRRMAFTGHAGAGPGDGVGLRDRGMLPDDGLDSLFACSTAPSTGTVLVTALRAEQRPACPTISNYRADKHLCLSALLSFSGGASATVPKLCPRGGHRRAELRRR